MPTSCTALVDLVGDSRESIPASMRREEELTLAEEGAAWCRSLLPEA
jgi:hypothetical protein